MMYGIRNYHSNYNSLNSISNSYLNYNNSVNQLKLQQALEKIQQKTGENTATGSVTNSASTFMKNYNSSMTDLLSSANSLRDTNSAGISRELVASSSNEDVLNVSKNYTLRKEESFDVSVQQLAAAQQNVTQAAASTEKATEDAAFSIVTGKGSTDINVSHVNSNGTVKTNQQLLQDVAKEINRQNIDVKASVEVKDGKSTLKLTSKNTGTDSSFLVNGDFAEKTGLDQTAVVAENAVYSVTDDSGRTNTFTSQSNKASLDYGKMTIELQKVGDAKVTVGVNNEKIADAVEDLVEKYNSALSVVSKNTDKGAGVESQLASMVRPPASEKSLEMIGITQNKYGQLSVDREKLMESLQKDPDLTKDIISGSNGLAQGAYQAAERGLSRPVNSLLSTELESVQKETSNDTINLMHQFSRSGAYNLNNFYSVGLLMNMLV